MTLAATGCSAAESHWTAQAPGSTANNVPALNNNLAHTAAGTVVPPNPVGPPKDPFQGTPADGWADGAAGIVLPKAEPVGGYTTTQVESAYKTTKKLLAAGFLDKQTLLGGAPTALENLLISSERTWFVANLNKKGVDKKGIQLSSRADIVSFAPGGTQLIGSVIKVYGAMSAKTSVSDGQQELDIPVDYLFAYPVEPPGHPERWTRVVVQSTWVVSFGNWQGAATNFAPWLTDMYTDRSNIVCGTTDGYIHPDYPAPVAAKPQPSASPTGTAVDPYALGHTTSGRCENITGT